MATTTASGRAKRERVVRFTGNGTWTVPAGVFYADVTCVGGGGGMTRNAAGVAGSNSAFASGTTLTGQGGGAIPTTNSTTTNTQTLIASAPANTGLGAAFSREPYQGAANFSHYGTAGDAVPMREILPVTPAASIAITVGAGGNGTGSDGGSGYVEVRWFV